MIRATRCYVTGEAVGVALVLADPLSFWGGVDVETGMIIDHSHPDRGRSLAGRILVMPGARGSSSSSSVLAETLRRGVGPCGLVLARPDPILTVGCLVVASLYGLSCPLVTCTIEGLSSGMRLRIRARTGDGGSTIDDEA